MPNEHNRMIISGTLPEGEVWSCSVAYKREETGDDNVIRDYDGLRDQAEVTWDLLDVLMDTGALAALLSSSAAINKVRWEYRNGTTLEQAAEWTATPLPGQGTMTKVFQTSLVFSLLTGRPGRSYRGRIFWPALGATISSSTGRLTGPTIGEAASEMAAFLKDAGRRGGLQPDVDPVVYSTLLDVVTPVTSVSVGNILDTQRRRRDSLVEGRATAAIPD